MVYFVAAFLIRNTEIVPYHFLPLWDDERELLDDRWVLVPDWVLSLLVERLLPELELAFCCRLFVVPLLRVALELFSVRAGCVLVAGWRLSDDDERDGVADSRVVDSLCSSVVRMRMDSCLLRSVEARPAGAAVLELADSLRYSWVMRVRSLLGALLKVGELL
jgi:hypothetical protein